MKQKLTLRHRLKPQNVTQRQKGKHEEKADFT